MNLPPSDSLLNENLNIEVHSSDEIKDEAVETMSNFTKFTLKLGAETEKRRAVDMKRMEELAKKNEALAAVKPKKYKSKKERKDAREG